MRKLQNYVDKYGPETGRKLYHALQSQAAHAGVSARLRRKIAELTGQVPRAPKVSANRMPLFDSPRPCEPTEQTDDTSPRVLTAVAS